MRIIKFRVYNKDSKDIINWEHLKEKYDLGAFLEDGECDFYSEPMQYTGLNDNNGKEIYEGDILSVDYGDRVENHEVIWGKWDDGEYLFNCECWMVDGIPLSDIHNKTWGHAKADVKVIGNIYENPELLEKF